MYSSLNKSFDAGLDMNTILSFLIPVKNIQRLVFEHRLKSIKHLLNECDCYL